MDFTTIGLTVAALVIGIAVHAAPPRPSQPRRLITSDAGRVLIGPGSRRIY